MDRIELNHWFVGEDSLAISFWHFYVRINFVIHEEKIKYYMFVKDQNNISILFEFNDLSSAIRFAEDIINKSESLDNIITEYKEIKKNKTLKKTIR